MNETKLYSIKSDEKREKIWNEFEKIEMRIKNLKAIAQNPTPINEDELDDFYLDVNSVAEDLKEIKSMVHKSKILYATCNEDTEEWTFL